MKHIIRSSIASLATLLLATSPSAHAQEWASPLNRFAWDLDNDGNFSDLALSWGETLGGSFRVVGQTFSAPATNPELRMIWALGSCAAPGDLVSIHVAPWDDTNQRVSGPPVFNSGPVRFAIGMNPKATSLRLPTPLMLAPGGRYIIIVRTPVTPGATIDRVTLGRTNTNPFPNGESFRVMSVTPGSPLDIQGYIWDYGDGTPQGAMDFGLQPAFTQAGPQKTVMLAGGKNGTGTPVMGSPGTTFVSFGIPSQNSGGSHAFVANVRSADGKVTQAVCAGENPSILARKGDPVPGLSGITFSAFKDPLLTEDGHVVILATLAGVGVNSGNSAGLFSYEDGVGWTLVARTGDEPPGVPGARIKAFRSIAACDRGISVLYQMVTGTNGTAGPGGVTAATDTALALTDCSLTALGAPIVREGLTYAWDLNNDGLVDGSGTAKSFSALGAIVGASGQGHGVAEVHNDGEIYASVGVQIKFTDGRTGNFSLWYDNCDTASPETLTASVAITGGTVDVLNLGDIATHEVISLGIPAQSSGGASAYVMRSKAGVGSVTSTNDLGIIMRCYVPDMDSDQSGMVVQKGTQPLGGGGAAFSSFMSPVIRQLGDTATHEVGHWVGFMAKLAGSGVASTNDVCLSRMVGDRFVVVAREGSEAPGVPGSQFKAFTSIAFMDYTDDSCMNALVAVGRMRAGIAGAAGPGGVTTANDEGLWLFDHNGDGHLAFREGEQHVVGGVTKTVKKFIVLPTVPFSPSQTRSHNAAGQIVLRAIYTDGTCGIIAILIGL